MPAKNKMPAAGSASARLKTAPAPDPDHQWPVSFVRKSMQEYFVARAVVHRLRDDQDGARRLLSAAPVPPEATNFTAILLQEKPDPKAFDTLGSFTHSGSDSYLKGNVIALLGAKKDHP